jgi:integrase
MRGSVRQRYKGSWSLVIDDYQTDATTGTRTRKRKWITVRGTRKQAEKKLTDVLGKMDRGEFVEPTKLTLGDWLREWLPGVATRCRPSTVARYTGIVQQNILQAPIATLPLQQIRPSHVETYYASIKASASTLTLHHTILQQALRKAMKDRLITRNAAADVDAKPTRGRDKGTDARMHCWTAEEARHFLDVAKEAGAQAAAFYALALDSGARKGELCGLRWADVDLDAGTIRLVQQLLKPGAVPVYGPLKAGRPRTITLAGETARLVAVHKRQQAELKMANRTHYHDHGLVFAKEYPDLQRQGEMLGHPLQSNTLGQRQYARLTKQAGVRVIKFHGLRHTCATLLLQAGEPVHVVSERLGHSKVTMTLEVYSHVLPNMQQRAAATIGAVLHG